MTESIANLVVHGFDVHPLVETFRRDRVMHDKFKETLDQIAERIQCSEQQSMTVVVGPTASGKTALTDEFGYQFATSMASVPAEKQTSLLAMELASPEQGQFKWVNDFYIPGLVALNEPCPTKKINVEALRLQLLAGVTKVPYSKRPETIYDYRNSFLAALDKAKAVGALIDEANFLRRPTSASGVFTQYNSLRSRSDACRTHFVLIGTAEVADIFQQSGPISKRVYPIWLAPYGSSQKEMVQFGNAVMSIVQKLPIRVTFSVEKNLKDLFEGALGLFGLVHDWFDRALIRAISHSETTITWADMQKCRLHDIQLSGIAADLIQYREVQTGVTTYLREQMKSLFLPSVQSASDGVARPPKRQRNPFERKPIRDAVGTS
jgi:hypothetical protein